MKTGRRMNFSKRTKLILVAVAVAVVLILRVAPGGGRDAQPNRVVPGTGAVAVDTGSNATTDADADPAATSAAPSGTAPASGDQGDGDDGVAETPTLVQPTSRPDTTEAATQFAAAWLSTYKRSAKSWRDDLAPRVTPDLAADLADADPATVPAGAKTGQVTVDQDGDLPIATAPIITADAKRTPLGTLKLTLVHRGSDWLVSEIDWEPRR